MATLSQAGGTPPEGAETTWGLPVPLITGLSVPHPQVKDLRVKR